MPEADRRLPLVADDSRRRQFAGAHINLQRRQKKPRRVERFVARGAPRDERVFGDAVMDVDVLHCNLLLACFAPELLHGLKLLPENSH